MPEEISTFAIELLDEKLNEFVEKYDLGDEEDSIKGILADLQRHAYDIGVYAQQNVQGEDSDPEAGYMLDRETLAKLILAW